MLQNYVNWTFFVKLQDWLLQLYEALECLDLINN